MQINEQGIHWKSFLMGGKGTGSDGWKCEGRSVLKAAVSKSLAVTARQAFTYLTIIFDQHSLVTTTRVDAKHKDARRVVTLTAVTSQPSTFPVPFLQL